MANKIAVLKKSHFKTKIVTHKHALWNILTILALYTYEMQQTASQIPSHRL